MQVITCNYNYKLTFLPFLLATLCLFLFFLTVLWDCFLCFPIKKRGKRSADPRMSPDLSTYMKGMTGIWWTFAFGAGKLKEQRRANTRGDLCTMTCQQYRKQETDGVTTVEWFIDFVMVYWHGHKGIMLPGNDVAVEKSKVKTCRFVESKNGLSLSQIVALFLSVFVGCQWIRRRLSPHFRAMLPITKTPWKASKKP